MYLQLARYLMKSYKYTITKKKELDPSVEYLNKMADLLGKKSEVQNAEGWNIQEVKTLIGQAVYQSISATA